MKWASFTKLSSILSLIFLTLTLINVALVSLVRADQIVSLDLKSNTTSTLTAGYTTTKPELPLDPLLYSGHGVWSPAVTIYRTIWIAPSLDSRFAGSHATWVNTAFDYSEAGTGDAWRLFKADFTLPSDITVQNASIIVTADDTFEMWFNAAVIGTSGNVYGEAPTEQSTLWGSVFGPYNFNPVSGLNTLYFVVRNYDTRGIDSFYSHGDTNPTGVLFWANVTYLSAGQSEVPLSVSEVPYLTLLIVAVGIVVVGIVLVSLFLFYRRKRERSGHANSTESIDDRHTRRVRMQEEVI